jgi:hypothetical protein
MLLSLLYHSPGSISPTLFYALVLIAAALTGIVYRTDVAAWHRARPRMTVALVAVLMAVVLATSRADALYVFQCSDAWRDLVCGPGESWCRTLGEWDCWLLSACCTETA